MTNLCTAITIANALGGLTSNESPSPLSARFPEGPLMAGKHDDDDDDSAHINHRCVWHDEGFISDSKVVVAGFFR